MASKLCPLPEPLASSCQPQLPCSFLLKHLQSPLSQAFPPPPEIWPGGPSPHASPRRKIQEYCLDNGEKQNRATPRAVDKIKALPAHRISKLRSATTPAPQHSLTLPPIKFSLELFSEGREGMAAFPGPDCILVLPLTSGSRGVLTGQGARYLPPTLQAHKSRGHHSLSSGATGCWEVSKRQCT